MYVCGILNVKIMWIYKTFRMKTVPISNRNMFKWNLTDWIIIMFSILILLVHITVGSRQHSSDTSLHYWETPYSQPYFDNSTRRDVTATIGQPAALHCKVRNLGDRAVSWIRKRDLHILTVGILTYTNDLRFQSLHQEGSDEWTLRISSSQARDSGTYECQVSTEPKISQAFRLNVTVSRAKIIGNTELFIKSGSDIRLTCVASQTPEPPSYIYWYKGSRVINYTQRGGINVLIERQTKTSKLIITKAQPSDSGNYTCAPSNSDASSVIVHVINGEHPAAMQHGNSSALSIFRYFTGTQYKTFNLNNLYLSKIINQFISLWLYALLVTIPLMFTSMIS